MCTTGDKIVVADKSAAISRAIRFGDDGVDMIVVDSKGLFRTLIRCCCAYVVSSVIIFTSLSQ